MHLYLFYKMPAHRPKLLNQELAVSQNMTGLHVSTAGQIARNEFNKLNQNLGIEFDNYISRRATHLIGAHGGRACTFGVVFQKLVDEGQLSSFLSWMHQFSARY